MNKKTKVVLILATLGIVLAFGVFFLIQDSGKPGELDKFAQCLKDRGAVFYGAFWCPHCQNQKAMFGKSAKLLPYTECSTPDGRGQLAVCKEKNITGYPTWEFGDGSREVGEVSIQKLSEKTGCQLL